MSRRRYRFDTELQQMVEVLPDYSGAERRAPKATEELTYGGLRSTDGVDLSSKRKHRDYMESRGLALASDCTGMWKAAAEERAQCFTPGAGYDSKQRREDIGRAWYQLEKRGRK